MGRECSLCGHVREEQATWGPLTARDNPFEVSYGGRAIPFTKSEAEVAFHLVQRGRISRDFVAQLAPSAVDGVSEALVSVRICNIHAKIRAAQAPVKVVTVWGNGYALEAIA